ncbi:hypothetical protein ASD80_16580 [Devosia sp. Root635]|nr:hypothetical protein ASD80_16580 [Devosia sp. Root635]
MGLMLAAMSQGGAQEAELGGWHLQEDRIEADFVNFDLSWIEQGLPLFALNCQQGFPEVYITVFIDPPADGAAPGELALADGERRVTMAAGGTEMQGRFAVDAMTSFGPDLAALLTGPVSVLVDGVEVARYTTDAA